MFLPTISMRSWFRSRILRCQRGGAGATPAERSKFQVYGVRQLAQSSLQNSAWLGRHQHAVPVWGHMCRSGETALQAVCGGCNSHCLHQFIRVMFRPAVCRTAVSKHGRKTTSGALPPSPTSFETRKRNSRLACLSSRR